MEKPKKPSEMNDDEFENYQKEIEKQHVIEKFGLDDLLKFVNLNLIDEDGNIVDKSDD